MSALYNIYCDESCHLEQDGAPIMVLGALWCLRDNVRSISQRIGQIKEKHGIPAIEELKWVKVSPKKRDLYLDLVDYFFDDDDLHFRCLIAEKTSLRHTEYQQTHDDWYFKMYFEMLRIIFDPGAAYNIYLDIKDTRSAAKAAKLHDVLCNANYDFSRRIIRRLQHVRSHEIQLMQLADILIGAVSYANRGLDTSTAKLAIVGRVKERSTYQLTRSTLLREQKINIFRWIAK